VRPVLRGPDETALAGLGVNVPEPFLKKHSVERRITMPGQSGKTVWAPERQSVPLSRSCRPEALRQGSPDSCFTTEGEHRRLQFFGHQFSTSN
jgi:hypothetical protein